MSDRYYLNYLHAKPAACAPAQKSNGSHSEEAARYSGEVRSVEPMALLPSLQRRAVLQAASASALDFLPRAARHS